MKMEYYQKLKLEVELAELEKRANELGISVEMKE